MEPIDIELAEGELELPSEPLAQLLPLHLVEGRERLVHEEHLRVVGEGAGDGDALDHAARELVGPLVLVPAEPELGEEVPRDEAAAPRDPLGEGHVVDRALPGEHGRALGDEPEHAVAARRRGRSGAHADLARGRLIEVGDDAEQRGLPAPRGADEGDELVGRDLEVHVIEGDGGAEAAGDAADRDRRGHARGGAGGQRPGLAAGAARWAVVIA